MISLVIQVYEKFHSGAISPIHIMPTFFFFFKKKTQCLLMEGDDLDNVYDPIAPKNVLNLKRYTSLFFFLKKNLHMICLFEVSLHKIYTRPALN